MKNKNANRSMVAVRTNTKNRVAKKVAGTSITIGDFFDEAAKERIKPKVSDESIRNKLFNHMAQDHSLTLTNEEISEIMDIVSPRKFPYTA